MPPTPVLPHPVPPAPEPPFAAKLSVPAAPPAPAPAAPPAPVLPDAPAVPAVEPPAPALPPQTSQVRSHDAGFETPALSMQLLSQAVPSPQKRAPTSAPLQS